MSVLDHAYPETRAGGFTRHDGTIQFYGRVSALVRPDMVVVDLGAGRGAAAEDEVGFRRSLATLKGRAARVIGIDIDPAVFANPIVDEAHVYDGGRLPLDDFSVDMVVADWTFEHVDQPGQLAAELHRVLKPGGWVCARTPHALSLVALSSRLVPNRVHARAIARVQPGGRTSEDVFPTRYRLNSAAALRRHFPHRAWENCSYTHSPEPGYHMGSRLVIRCLAALQWAKGAFAGEVLMIFLRKRS